MPGQLEFDQCRPLRRGIHARRQADEGPLPRKDKHGVDLISDVLPFGRLWYVNSDDAVGYAEFFVPAHNAVIRVYDDVLGSARRTLNPRAALDHLKLLRLFGQVATEYLG